MELYVIVAWFDDYDKKHPSLLYSNTDKGDIIKQFGTIKNLWKTPLYYSELEGKIRKIVKLSLYELSFNGVELIDYCYFKQLESN